MLTEGVIDQDEGNTNYSIMIPRELFDRRVTGELVAQSLIALGLPSIRLNERHDICLGPDKVYSILHPPVLIMTIGSLTSSVPSILPTYLKGLGISVQDHSRSGLPPWHDAHQL